MDSFINWINNVEWMILIVACLFLGLAPFFPPHIWEKLLMLFKGELKKPLDWFDLIMHGTPWFLLIAKIVVTVFIKK